MILVGFQHISQLICIRREEGQVHHALSQGFFVLICIHIGYGGLNSVDGHEAGSIDTRNRETGSPAIAAIGHKDIDSTTASAFEEAIIHSGIGTPIFNKGTIISVIVVQFGNCQNNEIKINLFA